MTFTLLDGGMGQELMARWDRPATPSWSADILRERPDLVESVHAEFLKAGADVLTLSGYAVTPSRLAQAGRAEEFEDLHAVASACCRRARDRVKPEARIAGCVPPLPGSYRPEERPVAGQAEQEYLRIIDAQADAVDLFLCETLPSVEEAGLATAAARSSGKPVWTALTVDEADGRLLRSGEPVLDGAEAALEAGADAVLVNCSPPEAINQALDLLMGRADKLGAYANGFTTVAPLQGDATVETLDRRRDLGPDAYAQWAQRWVRSGVGIVGGCCEVGPDHIAAVNGLRW